MRSVSEQPSAAGVADQLHGKISEKLASAVWIRPVGRLSGHFTRVAAVSNWPFPGDQLDATVALGGLLINDVELGLTQPSCPSWLP
jgi:hypothetical protein